MLFKKMRSGSRTVPKCVLQNPLNFSCRVPTSQPKLFLIIRTYFYVADFPNIYTVYELLDFSSVVRLKQINKYYLSRW